MRTPTVTPFAIVAVIVAAIVAATIVAPAGRARADDEASQVAYVSAPRHGRCYFKMAPDPKRRYDRARGFGFAYVVKDSAPDQLLWKTSGWYASRVALTTWCRYLVRLGNWPRGRTPSATHLGIAFYDRGRLIKRYSTLALLKDPAKAQPSVSHYTFLRRVVGFVKGSRHLFAIDVVDGKRWTFDVRSGQVISVK